MASSLIVSTIISSDSVSGDDCQSVSCRCSFVQKPNVWKFHVPPAAEDCSFFAMRGSCSRVFVLLKSVTARVDVPVRRRDLATFSHTVRIVGFVSAAPNAYKPRWLRNKTAVRLRGMLYFGEWTQYEQDDKLITLSHSFYNVTEKAFGVGEEIIIKRKKL